MFRAFSKCLRKIGLGNPDLPIENIRFYKTDPLDHTNGRDLPDYPNVKGRDCAGGLSRRLTCRGNTVPEDEDDNEDEDEDEDEGVSAEEIYKQVRSATSPRQKRDCLVSCIMCADLISWRATFPQ